MTHESIVHGQILSIEKLLEREINCNLTLNIKGVKSNLEFRASESEIRLVKENLGYRVYIQNNDEWQLVPDELEP